MPIYRIVVETSFTASHALHLPDGGQEPKHMHDWPVAVTVQSDRLNESDCVMDFHGLGKIVAKILEPWRGKHLNDALPFNSGGINPSAERVAEQIALAVAQQLSDGVTLVEVSVGETPGCTAVYIP